MRPFLVICMYFLEIVIYYENQGEKKQNFLIWYHREMNQNIPEEFQLVVVLYLNYI